MKPASCKATSFMLKLKEENDTFQLSMKRHVLNL